MNHLSDGLCLEPARKPGTRINPAKGQRVEVPKVMAPQSAL